MATPTPAAYAEWGALAHRLSEDNFRIECVSLRHFISLWSLASGSPDARFGRSSVAHFSRLHPRVMAQIRARPRGGLLPDRALSAPAPQSSPVPDATALQSLLHRISERRHVAKHAPGQCRLSATAGPQQQQPERRPIDTSVVPETLAPRVSSMLAPAEALCSGAAFLISEHSFWIGLSVWRRAPPARSSPRPRTLIVN